MRALPNTPSQRWARVNNACMGGRRRLGGRSLAQYWASCPDNDLHDLYWIARKLSVTDEESDVLARQERYKQALHMAYDNANVGRWKGQHVRDALESVIRQYKAHFPMWCF